jgi:hypothetical protein
MKIFSLDAEVDGLYGRAFAIAVTVRQDGCELASFQGRVADAAVSDTWVRDNVLPALGNMAITHSSSQELEEAFWEFWLSQKENAVVIAHCGSPVESGLFRRCVERAPAERIWSGPFPLHEVGTLLLALGEDPASVDGYVRKYGLVVPFSGVSHHPMYDAVVAAVVWDHAVKRINSR